MDKLIAFLKEKFDRELSRIKEILAEFIRRGEKSPAPEEAPTRSPSELKVLAEIDMDAPIYSSNVVANGTLYVATQSHLYAIANK